MVWARNSGTNMRENKIENQDKNKNMKIVDKYNPCPSKVTLNVNGVNFNFLVMKVLFIILWHVTVLSNKYMEYYHWLDFIIQKFRLLYLPSSSLFII